jgi:nucleoid-associated protein YgaU
MAKVKIYTGADGTLFHIAAREYGDATQWVLIAAANKISDPIISGTVTLTIPDPPPTSTGGIQQQ